MHGAIVPVRGLLPTSPADARCEEVERQEGRGDDADEDVSLP